MVEAQQSSGGIGTAAADAAAHGQYLVDPDIDPLGAAGLLLEFFRRLDDQIAVVGYTLERGMQANHTVIAQGESDFIAVVEKLEQGL
ncbi:hypothetical protein BLX41_10185 [Pseudomonas protegens]|nr:hypothetical protein BLX41_10185 [Pseudomonas protegens]